ncbi:flagellar export chaperone FliS [Rhodobacteraceae bacterium nBUS_22]|jgi:flagellar protein FliS
MNKFVGQQAYQSNSVSNPKIDDAHGAISVCLETLLHNLKVLAEKPPHGSELFNRVSSKCLTAIYILQTSLDFEKGAAVADSLFKLYEYVKYQVIANIKREQSVNLDQSIGVISEIYGSWKTIK